MSEVVYEKSDYMHQLAAFPTDLEKLVESVAYREGWRFTLADMDRGQGCSGLTLVVTTLTVNSYHPEDGTTYRVNHYFPVPAAAYDIRSWRRWLFDRVVEVETHEAMEFFRFGDERPYAPSHGPGNDPYIIREIGTVLDQKTKFTGEVND